MENNQLKTLINEIVNTPTINKSLIQDCATKIIDKINEGVVDPLEFYTVNRVIKDVLETVVKSDEVSETVIKRLEEIPKGDRTYMGVDFELRNSPAKWDYSGDEEWLIIEQEIKHLKERQKLLEKSLQANYNAKRHSISETGEVSDSRNISVIYGKPTVVMKIPK